MFFMCGCWDRTEINDLAIVTGTALDLAENGDLICTLHIAVPASPERSIDGGGANKGNYYVITAEGKSGNEIHRKLQKKSSRLLFLSHRSVVFIGERLARRGLQDVLDIFTHDPKNRLKTYLMIVKGGAARDILDMNNPLTEVPIEVVKEIRGSGDDLAVTLRDFYISYLSEGVEPVIGVVKREDGSKDPQHQMIAFTGAGVLDELKLVGLLDEKEALALLWITNKLQFGRITTTLAHDSGEIGMVLNHTRGKITIKNESDPLRFLITLDGQGSLVENNSELNINEPKDLERIQTALQDEVAKQMKQLLFKLQRKFKVDSVGFGQEIYKNSPKKWSAIKDQWDARFPEAQVEIDVNLTINGAGMIHSTFESSEGESGN
jgi:spore germination protein KC